MIEKGKWTEEVKISIIANNGSVQHLDISQKMKDKYRTVWEIPMKFLIEINGRRNRTLSKLIETVMDNGDIYEAEYEGLYSVSEERFITEKEAEKLFVEKINIFGNNITRESVIRNKYKEISKTEKFINAP